LQRNQQDSIFQCHTALYFRGPPAPPEPFSIVLTFSVFQHSRLPKPPHNPPNCLCRPSPTNPTSATVNALPALHRNQFPLLAPKPPQPANPPPAHPALTQTMARPPKNKAIEPAKIAVAPPPQQRHIDVDNFIRVRDSVSSTKHFPSLPALHHTSSHRQRV